jgi:hypothetical protein
MTRKSLFAACTCLLTILLTVPAFSQQRPAAGGRPAERQTLKQRRQQIEQRRTDLNSEKSAVEAERKNLVSLKRSLREARAQAARERKGSRKWICNAYNSTHDGPSECSDPGKGGHWITESNPNAQAADDRVRELERSVADAERRYAADLAASKTKADEFNADARKLATEINNASSRPRPVLLSGDAASVRDYTQRVVDRNWAEPIDEAVKNLKSDTNLSDALAEAAAGAKYLKESDLKAIVAIESRANRATGINEDGYAGLFQMGKKAAKDVGYDYDDLKDPADWKTNVEAGTNYLDKNAGRLAAKGLPVNALNVYLYHQQGPKGAPRILQEVADGTARTKAASKNMLKNLPPSYKASMSRLGQEITVQNFYDYFSDTFNKVNSAVNPPRP